MLAQSLSFAMLAWIASAVITFYILLIVSTGDVREILRSTARRSAAGMWFAPAMILLTLLSPVALAASIALAMNTTRLLILQCVRPPARGLMPPRSFGMVDVAFLRWNSVPALSGGFAILASVVALLWRRPMTTAILLVASAAIITALNVLSGGSSSRKTTAAPPSSFSIVLTILLAMMTSAGGIEWKLSEHGESAPSPTQVVTSVYVPPVSAEPAGPTDPRRKAFPGVILRPDVAPDHTMVIPTRVPAVEAKSQSSLVFSGEYWMFQAPMHRPPSSSLVSKSSPAERVYFSVDASPIIMEAVQPLIRPVETACCSEIRMIVKSTDSFPPSLEMILMDSRTGQSVSLGAVPVVSATLSFRLPRSGLRQFDAIRIVYHRPTTRIDKSAKVAIERFVFVPR